MQGLIQIRNKIAGIARNRNGIAGIGKRERSGYVHRSGIPPTSFMQGLLPKGYGISTRFRAIPAIPRDPGDLFNLPFIASTHSTRLYLNLVIP
jgi:hypothetical protein